MRKGMNTKKAAVLFIVLVTSMMVVMEVVNAVTIPGDTKVLFGEADDKFYTFYDGQWYVLEKKLLGDVSATEVAYDYVTKNAGQLVINTNLKYEQIDNKNEYNQQTDILSKSTQKQYMPASNEQQQTIQAMFTPTTSASATAIPTPVPVPATTIPAALTPPQAGTSLKNNDPKLVEALRALGYTQTNPDDAIKAFQKANNLEPDGKAGVLTVTAINNALAEKRQELAAPTAAPTQKQGWLSKIFGKTNKAQAPPTPTVGQVDAIKIGGEIKDGVLFTTAQGEQIFEVMDGKTPIYYLKPKDGDWNPTPCPTCGDEVTKIKTEACKGSTDNVGCMKGIDDQITYHQGFANFMKNQRKFTFQEGITMGSNLWALGTKFKFWSEASNPMSQLNEFFTNSKTGLWISGNWEKSICWEETDFNNPNDGIAFVPGTENVGAWVAGEVITIRHPTLADPTTKTTDYIYRITSVVDPRGLTTNSGSANCLDFIDFQYLIDGHAIDLDLDGKTSDDIVRILCDSSPFSLTGRNAIVRNSTKRYGSVCIQFQAGMLKPSFYNALEGGKLCAPIVAAGTEQVPSCSWCPGIFTDSLGATTGGEIGFGSPYSTSYGGAPTENRPGVANPESI